jgi:hypothetical protein
MLLPALAKAKVKAKSLQCLNNQRQLSIAWVLYADDNSDKVPYSATWPRDTNKPVWVQGELDFNPNNPSNWDVNRDIKISPLFPYCGASTAMWRCPADRSVVKVNGQLLPRVRTMAMNAWVGGQDGKAYPELVGPWRVFNKISDMTAPGPSSTWLLIDQREDALNPTAGFDIVMTGFPNDQTKQLFYDYPAMHHNRGAVLCFADGHSEAKHWLDPRTTPRVLPPLGLGSSNNPDLFWMQQRSTTHQ